MIYQIISKEKVSPDSGIEDTFSGKKLLKGLNSNEKN